MVGWFTVVTDRDDNSGLALLFAGELRFCGRDFIAGFQSHPCGVQPPRKIHHPLRTGRWHRARLAAHRLRRGAQGRGRPTLAEGGCTFAGPPNNRSQDAPPPMPILERVNPLPDWQSALRLAGPVEPDQSNILRLVHRIGRVRECLQRRHKLVAVNAGRTDTAHSTCLYVPSIGPLKVASNARPRPINCTRRAVPPVPACRPRMISGWPISAFSREAKRMSSASSNSLPAPRTRPRSSPIVTWSMVSNQDQACQSNIVNQRETARW